MSNIEFEGTKQQMSELKKCTFFPAEPGAHAGAALYGNVLPFVFYIVLRKIYAVLTHVYISVFHYYFSGSNSAVVFHFVYCSRAYAVLENQSIG